MTEPTTVRRHEFPFLFGASPEFWSAWWEITLQNWPLRSVSQQQFKEMVRHG